MMKAQVSLGLAGRPTASAILDRIREESRDEAEKGCWFEQLFMRVALQEPEFEIDDIWRWPDWPERETLTGLDGRDIGIDLVAQRTSGEWVAIQCKCYDDRQALGKEGINKFLGGSQQPVFRLRWIVATCKWVPIAVPEEKRQKALAAWWNSTPARLMLLNRRARKLTYPMWQFAHLREIRIPKPNNPAWSSLRSAFKQVSHRELLPMKQAEECKARKVIDDDAVEALGIAPDVLADWRRRLAMEPTITNVHATTLGKDT